jgi:[CysO sulfur-carrier protein]-S-L-cysteine hydrolase
MIQLTQRVIDELAAHAREEAPNECCGLLVGTGDLDNLITDVVRCRNVEASPVRYQLDPAQHIAANRALRGTGRRVVGAYHSHPRSPADPSETDVRQAYYPEFVWLIVSLARAESPEVRAYRLANGNFVPEALVPVA